MQKVLYDSLIVSYTLGLLIIIVFITGGWLIDFLHKINIYTLFLLALSFRVPNAS